MIISLIAAVAQNRVIGKDNTLIWHLREDLQRFKRLTSGHHIIMGRKNYEDIGRPLPNRTSIIITRQMDYSAQGCLVVHSLEEALETAQKNGELEAFIIGGAQIYEQALPLCNKLYLTEVHKEFQGDVFFPEFGSEWKEIEREGPYQADETNECEYSFVNYEK